VYGLGGGILSGGILSVPRFHHMLICSTH